MGLFNRPKRLGEYKILEVVNEKKSPIGVNGTCKVLFEDENVQYLFYRIDGSQNKSGYLLRREKNNKGRTIYLGSTIEPVCYCNGKLFTVSPYAISIHNHCMTMIDCITGERQEVDFLEQEEILGIDSRLCNDTIKKLSSTENCIVLYVLRKKSNDPKLLTNLYNEDFTYNIEIVFQNGLFSRQPLTESSIVKRGPWPKSKVVLPPPPYTAADLEMLYGEYGKEAVDEAILLQKTYG